LSRPVGMLGGSGSWSVLVDESGAGGGATDWSAEFDDVCVVVVVGCALVESSVGPMCVVMLDELAGEPLQLALVPDQGLVQEFVADCADPAFGECVGLWSAESAQRAGVNAEEVGCNYGLGLAVDELAPGRPSTVRCGLAARVAQDLPHGRGSDAVSDPPYSPWMRRCPQVGFLVSSRGTRSRSSVGVGGRPVRGWGGWVQWGSRSMTGSAAASPTSSAVNASFDGGRLTLRLHGPPVLNSPSTTLRRPGSGVGFIGPIAGREVIL